MNKAIAITAALILLTSPVFSFDLWKYSLMPHHELVYFNPPVKNLEVKITSGTEYAISEYMDLEVQLTNEQGQPISNANCQFNLYYPNKTLFKQTSASYLDYGIYYDNSIKAPSVTGTYTYSAKCSYDSKNAYASKCLQVKRNLVPSGTIEAPCDFFLNGSEEDYNSFKEYVTTVNTTEGNQQITSILKVCWKE